MSRNLPGTMVTNIFSFSLIHCSTPSASVKSLYKLNASNKRCFLNLANSWSSWYLLSMEFNLSVTVKKIKYFSSKKYTGDSNKTETGNGSVTCSAFPVIFTKSVSLIMQSLDGALIILQFVTDLLVFFQEGLKIENGYLFVAKKAINSKNKGIISRHITVKLYIYVEYMIP